MPSKSLKRLAAKHGKSISKAEEYWEFGKDQAKKKGLKGDGYYAYAMEITKRRLKGESENASESDYIPRVVFTAVEIAIKNKKHILSKNLKASSNQELSVISYGDDAAFYLKSVKNKNILGYLEKISKKPIGRQNVRIMELLKACVNNNLDKKYQSNLFYLSFRFIFFNKNVIRELELINKLPETYISYLFNREVTALKIIKETQLKLSEPLFIEHRVFFINYSELSVQLLEQKRLPRTPYIVNSILLYLYTTITMDLRSTIKYFKNFEVTPDDSFIREVTRELLNSSFLVPVSIQKRVLFENPKVAKNIKNLDKDAIIELERKLEWREKKFLPSYLTADQISILRFMDLTKTNSITIKDLKEKFNFTPLIREMIAYYSGKDLSRDDVINYKSNNKKDALTVLTNKSRFERGKNWRGMQQIFKKKQNLTALYVTELENLLEALVLKTKNDKELVIKNLKLYSKNSNHPKSSKGLTTLGWVRYTLFGKTVWIDEVQSDMSSILKREETVNLKKLIDIIAKEFIRSMRAKGFGKFYYPSHEIKTDLYDAEPPVSIYEDTPKKLRFKRVPFENVPENIRNSMDYNNAYDIYGDPLDYNLWELASIKSLN